MRGAGDGLPVERRVGTFREKTFDHANGVKLAGLSPFGSELVSCVIPGRSRRCSGLDFLKPLASADREPQAEGRGSLSLARFGWRPDLKPSLRGFGAPSSLPPVSSTPADHR